MSKRSARNFEEWWQKEGHRHLPRAGEPPEHAWVARQAWNAALDEALKVVSSGHRAFRNAFLAETCADNIRAIRDGLG